MTGVNRTSDRRTSGKRSICWTVAVVAAVLIAVPRPISGVVRSLVAASPTLADVSGRSLRPAIGASSATEEDHTVFELAVRLLGVAVLASAFSLLVAATAGNPRMIAPTAAGIAVLLLAGKVCAAWIGSLSIGPFLPFVRPGSGVPSSWLHAVSVLLATLPAGFAAFLAHTYRPRSVPPKVTRVLRVVASTLTGWVMITMMGHTKDLWTEFGRWHPSLIQSLLGCVLLLWLGFVQMRRKPDDSNAMGLSQLEGDIVFFIIASMAVGFLVMDTFGVGVFNHGTVDVVLGLLAFTLLSAVAAEEATRGECDPEHVIHHGHENLKEWYKDESRDLVKSFKLFGRILERILLR